MINWIVSQSVQSLSQAQFTGPWTPACRNPVHANSRPGWNSCPLCWWCRVLHLIIFILLLLPSNLCHQDLFQWLILCIRWQESWEFQLSIFQLNIQDWSPLGGLVPDLLAIRNSPESSQLSQLKHHNWHSAFLPLINSLLCWPTGKTITLTN